MRAPGPAYGRKGIIMEEEEKAARNSSVSMWPGIAAGTVIGVIAFVLSFDALRLVFMACGINPWLSWGGPVCVDGTILLCTWATWGFRKAHIRGAWYPWLGLVLFSLFSIAGNALHAVLSTGVTLPAWVPPLIMSIPPIALLYATHLIVIIAGDRLDKSARAVAPAADVEPAIGMEPVVGDADTVPAAPAVPDEGRDTEDLKGEEDGPADLFDWRVPVPRTAGQEPPAPKAFGGDDIMGVTPTITDTNDTTAVNEDSADLPAVVPAVSTAGDTADLAGDGTDDGQADPGNPGNRTGAADPAPDPVTVEPEPVAVDVPTSARADDPRDVDAPVPSDLAGDGLEAAGDGSDAGDGFPRPVLHDGVADDDDWMAWGRWVRAHGVRPGAERAVTDGLTGSLMTARRAIRRLGLR